MEQDYRDGIQWFFPEPINKKAITITHANYLTLNQALMAEMPGRIKVGVRKEDQTIHLMSSEEMGYLLPKSGIIRDHRIIEWLLEAGVTMPARFSVVAQNDGWVASLVKSKPTKFGNRTKPQKPNDADLKSLEKEEKTLCNKKTSNRKR